MPTKCPNCKNEYENINRHWSSCGYPKLSQKQKDIIIGCLMGDATIGNRNGERNRNPRWTLVNTNPDYVQEINKKLQPFSTLTFINTEDGYKKQYRVRITHPWLENLCEWYTDGKKTFPEDLQLNPTKLKHWYVCDGHKDTRDRFTIAATNERNNVEKICQYFTDIGFDVGFDGKQIYSRNNSGKKNIRLHRNTARRF